MKRANVKTSSEMENDLPIPSLSRCDIVSKVLKHLNATPIKTFIAVLVFNLLTNVVPALCLGAWEEVNLGHGILVPGLSKEPGAWSIFCLGQPMILAYFVWIQSAGDDLVRGLIRQGSVVPAEDVVEIIANGSRQLNSPWLSGVAAFLGLLVQGFVILLEKGIVGNLNPTWINAHPAIFWSRSVVAVPVYYALAVFVFSLGTIIRTLNRIMSTDKIRVQQCCADNARGLGIIGQLVANLGYLAFSIAGVVLVLYWQSTIVMSFGNTGWLLASAISAAAYLTITPAFFFLSLYPTHKAMQRYRDRLLTDISMELEKVYHQAHDKRSKGPKAIEKHLLKLRQLDELREFTLRLPQWPFTLGDFRKYYGLVSSPIISFMLGLSTEWIAIRYFQ